MLKKILLKTLKTAIKKTTKENYLITVSQIYPTLKPYLTLNILYFLNSALTDYFSSYNYTGKKNSDFIAQSKVQSLPYTR